jgi:hypothetical protein
MRVIRAFMSLPLAVRFSCLVAALQALIVGFELAR